MHEYSTGRKFVLDLSGAMCTKFASKPRPRNFLFQKFTILSIFLQNALRSLIAVKHSILSESDDVKSASAA